MADLSPADLDYYNKVVQQPEDFNINDLRRAYYIGVLGGEITPGGPLSTFEQYIYDQITDPTSDLFIALRAVAPPGAPGAPGEPGPAGPPGPAGTGIAITGSVATYAALPGGLSPADLGNSYLVEADGLLYIWSGTSFPADGNGVPFQGPEGPQGPPGTSGSGASNFAELGGLPSDNAALNVALTAKATDVDVVHDTGNETIAGIKTFSSPPIVPNNSFATSKIDQFAAQVDTRVNTYTIVGNVARNHPSSGAPLPAPPAAYVFWKTVAATLPPTAMLPGDTWINTPT